jgi:hypothetical protein
VYILVVLLRYKLLNVLTKAKERINVQEWKHQLEWNILTYTTWQEIRTHALHIVISCQKKHVENVIYATRVLRRLVFETNVAVKPDNTLFRRRSAFYVRIAVLKCYRMLMEYTHDEYCDRPFTKCTCKSGWHSCKGLVDVTQTLCFDGWSTDCVRQRV